MTEDNTICAISTPAGSGAIAVIRLSGKESLSIIKKIFFPYKIKATFEPNKTYVGDIKYNKEFIDQVIISYYKAPKSYTGEDMVEISCHGSLYIQQKILSLLIDNGAKLAQPGEFTLRAFFNNKLDLAQAEGVADLISSQSKSAHKLAVKQMRGGFSKEINELRQKLIDFVSLIELELDFSEEDVEFADRSELKSLLKVIDNKVNNLLSSFKYGNVLKNGIPVVIAGEVNTGKSTLLNKLLSEDKAIVTEIPGTTRDYIEDTTVFNGYLFRFIDTAGIRKTDNPIEKIGINKSHEKIKQATIVIALSDRPEKLNSTIQTIKKNAPNDVYIIPVINKIDLLHDEELKKIPKSILKISAKNNKIDTLIEKLTEYAEKINNDSYSVIVTNVRHYEILMLVKESIKRIFDGFDNNLPSDLIAQDIREAVYHLGAITGQISDNDILENIFKNFCIGK
ncbi:MAG: tRNA uridine-5-carboxymethylaminomethyl(34) synthesis GTPase MnmE [Marinilabiliales bacterium]